MGTVNGERLKRGYESHTFHPIFQNNSYVSSVIDKDR